MTIPKTPLLPCNLKGQLYYGVYFIPIKYAILIRVIQVGSDKAMGGAMLLAASVVFTYYTTWAMLLVSFNF